jgi:hypothetical protein
VEPNTLSDESPTNEIRAGPPSSTVSKDHEVSYWGDPAKSSTGRWNRWGILVAGTVVAVGGVAMILLPKTSGQVELDGITTAEGWVVVGVGVVVLFMGAVAAMARPHEPP